MTKCGGLLLASMVSAVAFAGNPPAGKTVLWDDEANTLRITYENTSGALGGDFWITNRVYDATTLELIEPTAMIGKKVERFVVDITNATLRAWFQCQEAEPFEAEAPVFDIVNGTLDVWQTDWTSSWSYRINYQRPKTVFRVHENAVMQFHNGSDAVCNYMYTGDGKVILRGGRIVQPWWDVIGSAVFETRDGTQNGNALHIMGNVRAEASAQPSVISARRISLDTFCSAYPCVFDVEEGAVLEIDAEIVDNSRGGKVSPSGFVKRGKGRLVLKRPSPMTGAVSVEEGTLALAEGASMSNVALFEVYDDASVELAPGVPSIGGERINVPAAVRKATVRLDATRVWGNDQGSNWDYNSMPNLGTSGGRFMRNNAKNALTFYPGMFRGPQWPSFRLNWVDYTLTGFSNPSRSLTMLYSMRHLTTSNRDEWKGVYSVYNGVAAAEGQDWNANNDVANFRLEMPNKNAKSTGYDARYIQYRGSWGETGLTNYQNRPVDEAYVDCVVLSNLTLATQSFVWEQHFTNTIQTKTSTLNFAGALNHDTFRLGCRPRDGAACSYQSFGEMMMFCGNVLSAQELADIKTYLKTKWFGVYTPHAADGTNVVTFIDVAAGRTEAAKGKARRAVKRGAGTLTLNAASEVADDLSVEEGTVAFLSNAASPKVLVWADFADAASLKTDASGRVLSLDNKGALGGAFRQTSQDAAKYGTLVSSGAGRPQKVMRCNYCTYDFLDDRLVPSDRETLTSIVVFKTQTTDQWQDMFGLTPTTDVMADTSKTFAPRFYFESASPFFAVYQNETNGGFANAHIAYGSHTLAELKDKFSILGVEMPPAKEAVYFSETELDGGKDKLELVTSTLTNNRRFGGVRLGGRVNARVTGASWWSGDIAEALVFKASLTDGERKAVMDYLRAKWYRGETVEPPAVLAGATAAVRESGGTLTLADGVTVKIDGSAVAVDRLVVPAGAEVVIDPGVCDKVRDKNRELITFKGGSVEGKFVLPPSWAPVWSIVVKDGIARLERSPGLVLIVE